MKNLIVLISLLFSISLFAKDKLTATPANSPVKETYVKVKLEGFTTIAEVFFKPKNGPTEIQGEVVKEGATFIGKLKGSALKPGTYEYRVKIRTASGKSEQDEAASTAFFTFVIDASLEVADPGIDGEQTLLGIDKDLNKIRDDVQRWINEAAYTKNQKNALKQLARRMQEGLMVVNDKQASIQATVKSLEAGDCLAAVMGSSDLMVAIKAKSRLRKTMEVEFYNTKERLVAEDKKSQNFNGSDEKVYPFKTMEQRRALCEFTIE